MKTNYILQTLVLLFFVFTANAQQGINYKAIIKDGQGSAIANTEVTVQFTILESGTTNVYQETHTPTTDANGIVIVNIGEGTVAVTSGVFNDINWGNNPHFLKTEINTGSGLTDMGTTEFKTVPYALHAQTVGQGSYSKSIGDSYGGGIIFYLDASGQHGLVVATTDQSTGIQWDKGVNTNTTAFASSVGGGWGNTSMIVFNQGDGTYAARLCYDLSLNGYSDWYLPSKYELMLMHRNKSIIDATAVANGGNTFVRSYYWSSTELNNNVAWIQPFGFILSYSDNKSNSFHVRAVRAF